MLPQASHRALDIASLEQILKSREVDTDEISVVTIVTHTNALCWP